MHVMEKLFIGLPDHLVTKDLGKDGGSTGYLDGIVPFVQEGRAVLKGLDADGRMFIRIQVYITTIEKSYEGTFTVFQRYADNKEVWAVANNTYDSFEVISRQVDKFFQEFGKPDYEAIEKLVLNCWVRGYSKNYGGTFEAALIGGMPY